MGQQVKTGKQMPAKFREVGLNFLISLIALVLAIITGGIIIWLFGNNPIEAYNSTSAPRDSFLWERLRRALREPCFRCRGS